MKKIIIKSLLNADKNGVTRFLKNEFSRKKSDFLIKHGEWLHNGNENRYVLLHGRKVIGYFGIIPIKVHWGKKQKDAFWWIDLFISSKYRGKGYQKIVDEYIRNKPGLKIGFPNKIAAIIHKKNGWTICDQSKVMMIPIKPSKSSLFKGENIFLGNFFDFLIKPLIHLRSKTNSKWSYKDMHPNFDEYADIFRKTIGEKITIEKNSEYFKWRYFNSPYKNEYDYYVCQKSIESEVILISRRVVENIGLKIRIVDMFGNLNDSAAVKDLVGFVINDSIKSNALQISILESNKSLQILLFQMGFIFFSKARFCYFPESDENRKEKLLMRWSLSDSDNDFLD